MSKPLFDMPVLNELNPCHLAGASGDTLKVCYAFEKNGKRTTEFAGKGDGRALVMTYKRVKK
jgi:hypothetical protein